MTGTTIHQAVCGVLAAMTVGFTPWQYAEACS
jgi:hypothetical protein